jgi:hypothetical protein
MIWVRDGGKLADLTLEDGPGVWFAVLTEHAHVHIERCNIRMKHATVNAVVAPLGSYGFVMRDCEVVGPGGALSMRWGVHRQAYIGSNSFRTEPHGQSGSNLSVRGGSEILIENNEMRDGGRNFFAHKPKHMFAEEGPRSSSSLHVILLGNMMYNSIPRRHNAGETMYESGQARWYGHVREATENTMTVEGEPFEDDLRGHSHYVLIGYGRGLGQYREVVSNTENTLTVSPAWDVVPDQTTYAMVAPMFVESLWIDNTEEHTANWSGFWGCNVGHVVRGHILRDGSGFYLWANNGRIPSPVAYCELNGCWLTGRSVVRFLGDMVFGNRITGCEVIGFRYRPSFHGSRGWLRGADPRDRFAINLGRVEWPEGVPETAPIRAWNVIEDNHIYDGPNGIYIPPEARHTILNNNAIFVDGEAVVDESRAAAE